MNRDSLVFAIAAIIGGSLILVGVTAVLAPHFASAMYGVETNELTARTFVWATGIRDVAIGGWLMTLGWFSVARRVLGNCLLVAALIPAGDAIIVWQSAPAHNAAALALHTASAIAFLAIGFWLRRK